MTPNTDSPTFGFGFCFRSLVFHPTNLFDKSNLTTNTMYKKSNLNMYLFMKIFDNKNRIGRLAYKRTVNIFISISLNIK